jgi:hypothetical protein
MLNTIIEMLKANEPNLKGYSYEVREVNYENRYTEQEGGEYGDFHLTKLYKIRLLFTGPELEALENYSNRLLMDFLAEVDEERVNPMAANKDINGQVIFPTHEGGKYKISANIIVEA